MLIEPEINGASLVLVGSFNPAIFSPVWFARENIVTDAQADEADIEIIHKEIARFTLADFRLFVVHDRFQIETSVAPFIRMYDMAAKLFGETLPHTPLLIAGINRHAHFVVPQDLVDRIGHKLAPPQVWGDWAKCILSGKGTRHGGMRSLTMEQRDFEDRIKGHIRVRVEPSQRVAGIYVDFNDQYEVSDPSSPDGTAEILELMGKNFDKSMRRAEELMDQVLRLKDDN